MKKEQGDDKKEGGMMRSNKRNGVNETGEEGDTWRLGVEG